MYVKVQEEQGFDLIRLHAVAKGLNNVTSVGIFIG